MRQAEALTASKPTLKRTNSSRQYSDGLQGYVGYWDCCGIFKAFVFSYTDTCVNSNAPSATPVYRSLITQGKPIAFKTYADGGWQCAKCTMHFNFSVKRYTQEFLTPVLDSTGFSTVPSTYSLCYSCNQRLIDDCGYEVKHETIREWVADLFIYIPQEILRPINTTIEWNCSLQGGCGC
jgi:hypothetical protein